MSGGRIPVQVCAARVIAGVTEDTAQALKLPPGWRSIALLTADCDDALYCALDQATKEAQVEVVYGKSCYAGGSAGGSQTTGEAIGILAAPTPAQARAGLAAATAYLQGPVGFCRAEGGHGVSYFAHALMGTGRYLSALAGIPPGKPLAYLVAPPLESIYGLDQAMKAAEVKLVRWFAPPTETNFGGGLLTGSQSACEAACAAFAHSVEQGALRPWEE